MTGPQDATEPEAEGIEVPEMPDDDPDEGELNPDDTYTEGERQ